jgi:hypothetical protein
MKHIKKFNEEFDWDEVLRTGRTENQQDKWSMLEKDMTELVEKYKDDFGVDSYGVVDAMYQVLDGMFQKK